MSALDIQPRKDFTADWDAWHEQHQDRLAAPDGFLAITSINWLTETPARYLTRRGSGPPTIPASP